LACKAYAYWDNNTVYLELLSSSPSVKWVNHYEVLSANQQSEHWWVESGYNAWLL